MKAAILYKIKDIRIEDIEKPTIKPDEALVRVKSVGVCGSDVHYYLHGRIGDQIVKDRHILGHEPAGEIVEVGKEVKNLKVGMRVAVEPGISCGHCEQCKKGRYNICKDVKFLGTPPVPGAYREYLAYPAKFLYPIPDSVSYAEGSLVETLSVGMYAVELAGLNVGDDIAIIGCGPIGLVTLESVKSAGAGRIFVTDIIDERLKFAKKYAADFTVNAKKENVIEKIKDLTGGRGVDIVFECASSVDTLKQSIEMVATGGKIIWIGIPPEDYVSIPVHTVRRKEIVIKAVRRFKHSYPKCINAIAGGKVSVKDMVTHNFQLEDITKAFSLVENYADGVIKAMINI